MSLLPQRKKSAEEIAKLRESFGVPLPGVEGAGVAPAAGGNGPSTHELESAPAQEPTPPVPEEKKETPLTKAEPQGPVDVPISKAQVLEEPSREKPLNPIPSGDEPTVKVVRSLKRSERIPVLPVSETTASAVAGTIPERNATVLPELQSGKRVYSLRKSEQGPVKVAPPKSIDGSKLPVKRHDDRELMAKRLQEQLTQQKPPRPLNAHLGIVIPPYILALVAAGGAFLWDFPFVVVVSMTAVAFLIALLIFFRWPLSRHHAAFVVAIVILTTVFGALHFFPQLWYAT